jgi:hypothetical protein
MEIKNGALEKTRDAPVPSLGTGRKQLQQVYRSSRSPGPGFRRFDDHLLLAVGFATSQSFVVGF